jgi:type IV secretory pathway protease TraF
MKTILTAVALVIAFPALAQTAASAGHSGHVPQTGQKAAAEGAGHSATSHAGHKMSAGSMMDRHGKSMANHEGCREMMKAHARTMSAKAPSAKAAVDPHAGHKPDAN